MDAGLDAGMDFEGVADGFGVIPAEGFSIGICGLLCDCATSPSLDVSIVRLLDIHSWAFALVHSDENAAFCYMTEPRISNYQAIWRASLSQPFNPITIKILWPKLAQLAP